MVDDITVTRFCTVFGAGLAEADELPRANDAAETVMVVP
jgi:hypothetical protein